MRIQLFCVFIFSMMSASFSFAREQCRDVDSPEMKPWDHYVEGFASSSGRSGSFNAARANLRKEIAFCKKLCVKNSGVFSAREYSASPSSNCEINQGLPTTFDCSVYADVYCKETK